MRDAVIMEAQQIGGNKHTKLLFSKNGESFNAVYFGAKLSELQIDRGDLVDVYFNMDINNFQNVSNVQLIVRDVLPARAVIAERREMHRLYDDISSGNEISEHAKIVPSRADFAAVYTYLKRELADKSASINLYRLQNCTCGSDAYGYVKVRYILDIFNETGILSVSDINGECCYSASNYCGELYEITMNHVNAKVDLEKSEIYRKLLSQCNSQ